MREGKGNLSFKMQKINTPYNHRSQSPLIKHTQHKKFLNEKFYVSVLKFHLCTCQTEIFFPGRAIYHLNDFHSCYIWTWEISRQKGRAAELRVWIVKVPEWCPSFLYLGKCRCCSRDFLPFLSNFFSFVWLKQSITILLCYSYKPCRCLSEVHMAAKIECPQLCK